MIITTDSGKSIDTADLTPEERHILQKLFAWKAIADSLNQFRKIKDRAMKMGWNNSGPVQESHILKIIIQHLEKELIQRLKKEKKA
ncbi:hypothetical protein [Desulfobacula toluolica]|uniref:Transposase n=1 Tax=Desulfobacula toluolica (strain DSM 7467 / Tol2) TaxID=651182 RepID=K0NT06_DESTT|nr:hypothetical protein [Desulfobacula toluolica]CCK82157.1 uncharacterized protein TOL2_C40020 [Desulfobacula toluolica Tol2]